MVSFSFIQNPFINKHTNTVLNSVAALKLRNENSGQQLLNGQHKSGTVLGVYHAIVTYNPRRVTGDGYHMPILQIEKLRFKKGK